MKKTMFVCLCGLAVAGCVATTPLVDSKRGDAMHQAQARQTLNPAAGKNTDPVKGLDGKAAKSAHDEYQKSFVAPTPATNTFTIGVGGSGR